MGKVAEAAGVAIALLLIAACGSSPDPTGTTGSPEPTPTRSAFALSLISDRGGKATPVAAARWFVLYGGVHFPLPKSDWEEQHRDVSGATLDSGRSMLHVVQGADGTQGPGKVVR